MVYTQNARVRTAAGKDVGHVSSIVLDPKSDEVTHLVVRKGLLLTTDKVVPISVIDSTTPDVVQLHEDAGDLEQFSDFQKTYYVSAEEAASGRTGAGGAPTQFSPALYPYPPFGTDISFDHRGSMIQPDVMVKTTPNLSETEVALRPGANVRSRDDKHVGDIEKVLTNSANNRATHFVITQGLLFKARKLVPMAWVTDIREDQVRLMVNASTIERTPDYE